MIGQDSAMEHCLGAREDLSTNNNLDCYIIGFLHPKQEKHGKTIDGTRVFKEVILAFRLKKIRRVS